LMRRAKSPTQGRFIEVSPNDFLVTTKPADDGKGIIVRVQNVSQRATSCSIRFPELKAKSANLTSPVEQDGKALEFKKGGFKLKLPARAVVNVRVKF
jgi:alpha-mannosidase